MKRQVFIATWTIGVIVSLAGGIVIARAQGQQGAQAPPPTQTPAQPAPPPGPTHAMHTKDPRVGLKPGLEDAGQVARGLELVGHLPKPEAFLDPTGGLYFPNFYLSFLSS